MIGQTLNNLYTITARLGKGAMGTVYRATDTHSGREVALKIISTELVVDPEMLERFKREGEALSKLKHPNIVGFIDTFQHDENYVIVMEYIPGGSLYELIKAGPLPIERARQITLDLCDALIRAHRLNIIHRDLKPENILIDDDGTPKLADFGVARLSEGTRMTRSGTQVGTPYYMAPEAWEGKPLDVQADIWSLGVVLFEMLTGRVPFDGDTGAAVMNKILTAHPPDLKKLRAEVPSSFVKIVGRMLTRDKKRRYQTIRAVALDVEREQATKTNKARLEKLPAIPAKSIHWNSMTFVMMFGVAAIILVMIFGFPQLMDRFNNVPLVVPGHTFTAATTLQLEATNSPTLTLTPTTTSTLTRIPSQTPSLTPTPMFIEGSILFKEDFQSRDLGRIFGWKFLTNLLHVSNPGQYWNVQEEADGNRYLFGNVTELDETEALLGSAIWVDYKFELRAKVNRLNVDGDGFGISVRRSSDQGCLLGYEMVFGESWFLGLIAGPKTSDGNCPFQRLSNVPQKRIDLDRWYVVRVELYHSNIQVFVDDELIHNVSNDKSLSGGVGISIAQGAQVSFDDIRVVGLVER